MWEDGVNVSIPATLKITRGDLRKRESSLSCGSRRLGNLVVRWLRLWWRLKSSGKKTLGALSDCKIWWKRWPYIKQENHTPYLIMVIVILNFGDKMRYRVLGGYGSPYEKLMIRFISNWPLVLRHYITFKTGYYPRYGSFNRSFIVVDVGGLGS